MRSGAAGIVVLWAAWGAATALGAGDANDAAGILASARTAVGKLDGSTITMLHRDGRWRIADVRLFHDNSDANVTDEHLGNLSKLGAVESVSLSGGADFTAGGLAKLGDLKGLRCLVLPYSLDAVLTDTHVKALACLRELEELDLHHWKLGVDTNALRSLSKLRRLRQVGPHEAILALKDLEELQVGYGEAERQQGLKVISRIGELRRLQRLDVTWLDANGIAAVKTLRHLEHLGVWEVMPKDRVVDFSSLRQLFSLMVYRIVGDNRAKMRLPPGLLRLETQSKLSGEIDTNSLPAQLESVKVECQGGWRRGPNLAILEGLPALRTVRLDYGGDFELKQMTGLTSLRELELTEGCGMITSDGAKAMANLTGLESLVIDVAYRATTSETASLLLKMPRLRRLKMPLRSEADECWRVVASLQHLRALGLSRCWPEDSNQARALPHRLKSLGQLEELEFGGEVTDGLMGSIGGFAKLRRLAMQGAKLTDAQLAKLAALKELRSLDLQYSTGFSDKALAGLLDSLPNLRELKLMYRSTSR